MLKGPPREALEYLYRNYSAAILAYVRARLARGDFPPLGASDAEDLVHDFFVRLGANDWLQKPDRTRGRFRPFLVQRLVFFLRERRAAASGRPAPRGGEEGAAAIAAISEPDPLDSLFELRWKEATVTACLDRIARRNAAWGRVLAADLRRDEESDADLASALGMSLDGFRSTLKRARAVFREVYTSEEGRLDGLGGAA
jgi:DNA-directed RNA polymerase specialized sigma24 family protein